MQSLKEVTTLEFREYLTPGQVRTSQVIHFALAAGSAAFGVAVVASSFRYGDRIPSEGSIALISTLSTVHLFVAILAWFFSKYAFERQFSESNLIAGVTRIFKDKDGHAIDLTPPQRCISIIRTAWIIHLAVLEGAAFFGLAVAIMATGDGVVQSEPIYWLNITTAVLFIGYIFATFPSATRFEETFESRFHR